MLRFFLLGGRLGPVPWQLLGTLGCAALVGAGWVAVASLGMPLGWLLRAEAGGLAVAGVVLLTAAGLRRGRPRPPTGTQPPD